MFHLVDLSLSLLSLSLSLSPLSLSLTLSHLSLSLSSLSLSQMLLLHLLSFHEAFEVFVKHFKETIISSVR